MPDDVGDRVQDILEDNPEYDQGRAYAACKAQQALDVDSVDDVATLAEIDIQGEDLDKLASEDNEWLSAEAGLWAFSGDQPAAVYDPESIKADVESQSSPAVPDGAIVVEGLSAEAQADIKNRYNATIHDDVEQQADDLAASVFQVVRGEDSDQDLEDDLLGIGVDFPNAGVYVDWNIDAWPDDEQLDEPHVSDYGTLEDLEQATGGIIEPLETVVADSGTDAADE